MALEKLGVRPLGKVKGRKLLHHIYEQTHPAASDSETSYVEPPSANRWELGALFTFIFTSDHKLILL